MTERLDLERSLAALRDGAVVAIPTDTVYGVGADVASLDAVAKLFALKQRPTSVALPVLVNSLDQIHALGVELDDNAQRLSAALWPGALTIIVRAPRELAARIGSDRGAVGFRVPAHPLTRQLLARSGPLAVTSANLHGEEPCHTPEDVDAAFSGSTLLAGVLPGGTCTGTVSTVVDLSSDPWRVVRHGGVSLDAIVTVLGEPRD